MQKILAGNWKMFKTRGEVRDFFSAVGTQLKNSPVKKIVATSPTLLETALVAAQKSDIEIFAQNCAWAKEGAFTGETSPRQLLDLGVRGTLIGHSERRQYFGETDTTCVQRTQAALEFGLHVIYCIGESLSERQGGQTEAVLNRQIAPVLREIIPHLKTTDSFTLAYEPVWAIGTGLTATTEQVAAAHAFVAGLLTHGGAKPLPILYGGSVKPNNFKELSSVPHVAGGLVGGASLAAADYVSLHQCLS